MLKTPRTLAVGLIVGLFAVALLPTSDGKGADPVHIGDKIAEDYVSVPGAPFWLDVAALLDEHASTGKITLPFVTLAGAAIVLQPYDLRGPNYEAFAIGPDGIQSMGRPDLGTFRGYLESNPAQVAVFTIVPEFVHGVIHDPSGREHVLTIDTPLPATIQDGLLFTEVRETPGDGSKTEGPTTDPTVGAAGEYTTIPFEEQNLGTVQGWTKPTSAVWFDALTHSDGEFYNLGTSTVYTRAATNINDAEYHFHTQLNVAWTLVNQWTFTSTGQPSTATNCYTLKADVETNSDTYIPISTNPRDFMVFFSHRNFSGSDIGCAWEPGIHNPDDLGYAMVQTDNMNTDEEQEITMHEIGHLFHGEHKYARVWRDAGCVWLCKKGTIMIDEGLGNLFEFSEGDDLKYNSYRVRYCADHVSTCSSMSSPSKNAAEQLVL